MTVHELEKVYEEVKSELQRLGESRVVEQFENYVKYPFIEEDGRKYVVVPVIKLILRTRDPIKAPFKIVSKDRLRFYIRYWGLDKLYGDKAEHLDRIFLRSVDPESGVYKPVLSGTAFKASTVIPQWIFRYSISHVYIEDIQVGEGSESATATDEYVAIRTPHGTECFEFVPAGAQMKVFIRPDHKVLSYLIKTGNESELRNLIREGLIIYYIFRLIAESTWREGAIGSSSRGFGTYVIECVHVDFRKQEVTVVETIRSIIQRLQGLKATPEVKTTKKKPEVKPEQKVEAKVEQKLEEKQSGNIKVPGWLRPGLI